MILLRQKHFAKKSYRASSKAATMALKAQLEENESKYNKALSRKNAKGVIEINNIIHRNSASSKQTKLIKKIDNIGTRLNKGRLRRNKYRLHL